MAFHRPTLERIHKNTLMKKNDTKIGKHIRKNRFACHVPAGLHDIRMDASVLRANPHGSAGR